MPEKILFINQHAGFIGGLEKYISVVSGLLRERGFRTSLLYVERVKEFDRFAESFDEVYNMEESGKARRGRLRTVNPAQNFRP